MTFYQEWSFLELKWMCSDFAFHHYFEIPVYLLLWLLRPIYRLHRNKMTEYLYLYACYVYNLHIGHVKMVPGQETWTLHAVIICRRAEWSCQRSKIGQQLAVKITQASIHVHVLEISKLTGWRRRSGGKNLSIIRFQSSAIGRKIELWKKNYKQITMN